MAKGRLEYINKKNQGPSYCDRVLYRNNSCLQINEDYYNCLDTVYGSDHRPVALCLTVKDFFEPGNFCEIDRLFDVNNPHLGHLSNPHEPSKTINFDALRGPTSKATIALSSIDSGSLFARKLLAQSASV